MPVDEFLPEIERLLQKNPVLVLSAETGAGKSTRLPFYFWRRKLRVAVTQPRRLATRALSQFLAARSGRTWGQEIGYQTGFESRFSTGTRLLYLTDGVQLQKEIRRQQNYDLLVLDEIHEWNLNQEILIGLVRKNLESGLLNKKSKKVVIMSATLQGAQLASFLGHAPLISVPGRSFPVAMQHRQSQFLLPDTAALLEEGKNVLVFQPGKQEIEQFKEDLLALLPHSENKPAVLPLHSELSLADQNRVFQHYPQPKAVIATDIAQTSLTIDDIDVVMDDGIKKELRVNNGIEGLYPVNISQAECLQRAGRAGRVKSGTYILCADLAVNDREAYPEPEIRRLNLESVVLRMLKWSIDPLSFRTFHRPKKNLINNALYKLQVFGALDDQNQVSPDGARMADLPLSIRASRLLLEAEKGGPAVIDQALKLIALLESRGISGPDYQGEKLYSGSYRSDLLNQLALWEGGRRYRALISQKKAGLARMIYQELQRRLELKIVSRKLSVSENSLLFRALLSAFVDSVFRRQEGFYCREGELRELDRHSILIENPPDLLVGLPFDLLIRQQRDWPLKTEERKLSLLTFCSEISCRQLEELNPFSFSKQTGIEIESGRVVCRDHYSFGLAEIEVRSRAPLWHDKQEMTEVADKVLEWLAANPDGFPLAAAEARLQPFFYDALPLLPRLKLSFRQLARRAWKRKLIKSLRSDDLHLFIPFHPEFKVLTLADLLPAEAVAGLRKSGWPGSLILQDEEIPLHYRDGKPFLLCSRDQLARISASDTLLPTGENAGLEISGQLFSSWQEALDWCNENLRRELFAARFRDQRPEAEMADIVDLDFPQAVQGGPGLHKTVFEFFAVPLAREGSVHLVYFLSREEAADFFRQNEQAWQAACRDFKQKSLGDLFRAKGWKVR